MRSGRRVEGREAIVCCLPTNSVSTGFVSDGIPVAWIPRAPILHELMTADTRCRRELLLSRESEILDDCMAVVRRLENGPLLESAMLLTEAMVAARAGHHCNQLRGQAGVRARSGVQACPARASRMACMGGTALSLMVIR